MIASFLGFTGCTTFHGITAITPKAGHPYNPTEVESLQPVLKWKPSSQIDATYDVIIYEGIEVVDQYSRRKTDSKRVSGIEVYYREGLKETEHKVEEPLKPDKEYHWAVRVRERNKVSEWSSYDYFLFGGVAWVKGNNLWFMFKTPKK
jgi:hypothetical protein